MPDFFRSGPSGGLKGNAFEQFPGTEHGAVRVAKIDVRHGQRIDAIGLEWAALDGGQTWSSGLAGGDGGKLDTLSVPTDSYLTEIFGTIGTRKGVDVVYSMSFGFLKDGVTTKSATYGSDGKTDLHFQYQCPPGCHIIGLWGQAGAPNLHVTELQAVGVAIAPIQAAT